MKTKFIFFILFLFVAGAQIYVPASMILDREKTLATGKTFRFETRPIDPNDPFRGKFVALDYEQNVCTIPDSVYFSYDEEIYVQITEDENGFAKVTNVTVDPPETETDFIKASAGGSNYYNDSTTVYIEYPFDRFYMEEYKAPEAEKVYSQSQRDSLKISWAVVKVLEGNAVLEDVMIDGISIKDVVKNQQEN